MKASFFKSCCDRDFIFVLNYIPAARRQKIIPSPTEEGLAYMTCFNK